MAPRKKKSKTKTKTKTITLSRESLEENLLRAFEAGYYGSLKEGPAFARDYATKLLGEVPPSFPVLSASYPNPKRSRQLDGIEDD